MSKHKILHVGDCHECGADSHFAQANDGTSWWMGMLGRSVQTSAGADYFRCCSCGGLPANAQDLVHAADDQVVTLTAQTLARIAAEVAAADGQFVASEREILQDVAEELGLNPAQVLAMAEDAIDKGQHDLTRLLTSLTATRQFMEERGRLLMLGLAIQISLSDDHLHQQEYALIEQIAGALGFGRGALEIALELAVFGRADPVTHISGYMESRSRDPHEIELKD